MLVRLLPRLLAGALLTASVLSCDSPTTSAVGEPASLVVLSGDDQEGIVGTELPNPLVIRVLDDEDRPVPGQVVNFRVQSGGGSVFAGTALTNADGVAQERWTLGTSTSEAQRVEARAVDSQTGEPLVFDVFNATALADEPATVAVSEGDEQSATVGTAVPVPPAALVRDQYGNPVPGVQVEFDVLSGGGSITGASATTNQAGIARAAGWTLGIAAGANSVRAAVTDVGEALFRATGVAADPAALMIAQQPSSSARSGQPLELQPIVHARDAHGNIVKRAGILVTASSSSETATLHGTTQVATDEHGDARFTDLAISGATGVHAIRFAASGMTPVVSAPIALSSGNVAQLSVIAGMDQTAMVGTAVNVAPRVRLVDGSGNPVVRANVTFTVAAGGGAVRGSGGAVGASAVESTDEDGIARLETWTLGPSAGTNRLEISTPGAPMVTIAAIAVASRAQRLEKVAGDGQSATVGTAVATPPSVRVLDENGNPVAGVAVTFRVTQGAGRILGSAGETEGEAVVRTSDALGVATIARWTLGSTTGSHVLTVSVEGIPAVTFVATATAGTVGGVRIVQQPSTRTPASVRFARQPVIQLVDVNGNPVREQGRHVSVFVVEGPGRPMGSVSPLTNAEGQAVFTDLLIHEGVGVHRLRFGTTTATEQFAVFSEPITVTAPPTQFIWASGNDQRATVGTKLANPLVVELRDAAGQPVVGAVVDWRTQPGNGAIAPPASITDESGRTGVEWSVDTIAGVQSALAIVGAAGSLGASAVALADVPVRVVRQGNEQIIAPSTELRSPLAVTLYDRYGNAVPDVPISWRNISGGGSLISFDPATDEDGRATARLQVGATGEHTVMAEMPNLPAVEFQALAGRFRAVTVGTSISCGLADNGAVYCAGRNSGGMFGLGPELSEEPLPIRAAASLRFDLLAIGGHTCALSDTGEAYCWGANEFGQIGVRPEAKCNEGRVACEPYPAAVSNAPRLTQISVGFWHTCGVTGDGAAFCWGQGTRGELGDGSTSNSSTPVRVVGDVRFRKVAAGANATCGLVEDGRVYCWGYRQSGQIGTAEEPETCGSFLCHTVPVPIASTERFSDIAAGALHLCGLATDGRIFCWGRNHVGQTGDQTAATTMTPVVAAGGRAFDALVAGGDNTCGIDAGGLFCWGDNRSGQLGLGTTDDAAHYSPSQVQNLPPVTSASFSRSHACTSTADGDTYCWGRNLFGEIGDGTREPRWKPVNVLRP